LNNYVKKNELRVPQFIQMCYDIAKGMEYLEQCNIIHRYVVIKIKKFNMKDFYVRDLAARNCLIDKRGRVKVADFGLSRCLQSDEEYFVQIKEVPIRWWAVEVFANAPYTIKSDVWSYGITAWEVFSKADLPYSHIQHNHSVIDAVKRGNRKNFFERVCF
jgi:serine/threonine protein kinase